MPEVIINVPEELEKEFKNVMPVYWQLAVEKKIKEELNELVRLKKIISKSQLTEKGAKELADEVSVSLAERFSESRQ